ncbi:hypothetical protein KMP13_04025 [Epibacterium ulvae]|uniref:hypothetical protein n=1 Tax=Epibacterium ulvae TaxID=1156985 RepID=UPI001BFCC1A9|nr:hypothetical protein [Epibacterium ulvae]MBT8153071.1 hypothetical protein [Epibacterium ulvae]
MDKVWFSALIGAVTGGFTSCTCVVLLSVPLWSVLVIYPVIGAVITGIIYLVWTRLDITEDDSKEAMTDIFLRADALVK